MGKVKQLAIDVKRYHELDLKFNPERAAFMLVDVETQKNPDYIEFNLLCIKLAPYFKMISKLNQI